MKSNILQKRNTSGFTIVEVIVVIAVIGILVAIGTISYSGYQQRANRSSADATVQQVKLKLGEYFTDNNKYPADKAAVISYLNTVSAADTATAFNATKNSTTMTYTAKAADGVTNCTSTTPICAKYTITVAPAYWGGASGDSSISVSQ